MSRPGDAEDRWFWFIVIAVSSVLSVVGVVFFFSLVFLTPGDTGGKPTPEPTSSPTALAETATPSDLPEEEEEAEVETVTPPDPPEEPDPPTEEEEDDSGGRGDQNSGVQAGIQFGSNCAPVGALGVAVDGRPAECFMGSDGQARWGYDSDRG